MLKINKAPTPDALTPNGGSLSVVQQLPTQATVPETRLAMLDPALNIVSANAAFLDSVDRAAEEAIDCTVYDVLHPGAQNVLPRHFHDLLGRRRMRFVERVSLARPDRRVILAQLTGVAMWDNRDQLSGFALAILQRNEPAVLNEPDRSKRTALTPMSARVLEGVATGASTVQLASRLYLSRQGVEYHVGLLMRRLDVPNRAALVSKSYATGILTVGSWPPRVAAEFVR